MSLGFGDGLINNTICLFLDLYYNENYAGLAAEIFGLPEPVPTTNLQSDDSNNNAPSDETQLPSEDVSTNDVDVVIDPVAEESASDVIVTVNDHLVPTTELIVSILWQSS